MPLPPAAALSVSHPSPRSFPDVATNTHQMIRWSERQPFFPESVWRGQPGDASTCTAAPGAFGALMSSNPNQWRDLDNWANPFPHLATSGGRNRVLAFPHYKSEEYTSLRVRFDISGYMSGAAGYIFVMFNLFSLDLYERGFDNPPPPPITTINDYILANLYFNTLGQHHALNSLTVITEKCGAGWWVIEPTLYTSTGTFTMDTQDFFSMSIVECLPQPARWQGRFK